mgnify:CR=1 FL=1
MAYLKRNINLLLLVLCVLLIGFTLSITSYSQNQFETITVQYYDRVNEYKGVIDELQDREQALNTTSFELTRKTQDSAKLNELYSSVEAERDDLELTLKATQTDLSQTKAQLSAAQSTISNRDVEIKLLTNDADDYNELIGDLDDAIDEAKITDPNANWGDIDDIVSDLKRIS